MALWNPPGQQDELEPCPICLAQVAKRKKHKHLTKCLERNRTHLEDLGLVVCPLYKDHILPKKYLNHHLEGNCDAANNMLRKYFQKDINFDFSDPLPENFLPQYTGEALNDDNKRLVYFLSRDLGVEIGNDSQDEPNLD